MKKLILIGLCLQFPIMVACSPPADEQQEPSASADSEYHATLAAALAERSFHRSKEAVLWSQPLVGVAMTLDAIRELGGDFNDIAYLSQPANWKFRILTPNSVSLYVTSVIRTTVNEPMVVEVPPVTSHTDVFGTIMDSFQVPLIDVGSTGADKGEGGKYLILPVAYDGDVPDGYIPVRTERNMSFFNFRAIPSSFGEEDLAATNKFIGAINIYPLHASEQKGMHIDAYDRVFNTVEPVDATYFDVMTQIMNEETVVQKDLMMMGMLKSIGYNHGELFEPSAETRNMLSKAVSSAQNDLVLMMRDIAGPWWEGNPGWLQPLKPVGPQTQFNFVTDSEFAIDARAEMFALYCCGPVTLGSASAYILATRDTDGEVLDARANYTLHIPANVPVQQFWSLTAYDAKHAVFFEDVANTDISSLDDRIHYNDDGSIDLYVGPAAPAGKESNWIETNSDNSAVFLFRFYGPEAGAKDGSWTMTGFDKLD
jgi:hypothetical protein